MDSSNRRSGGEGIGEGHGNTQPPWRAELEALCELAIEDRLDVASRDRIEEIVFGDRGACRFYVDYLQQHASLRWAAGRPEMIGVRAGPKSASDEHRLTADAGASAVTQISEAEAANAPSAIWRRWPRALRIGVFLMSAAAVLLLGLWIGHRSFSATNNNNTVVSAGVNTNAPQVIAELVSTKAAKWDGATLPTADGAGLTAGTLHLAEGVARLKFARGAEISLEGPAELKLVSADTCVLTSGRLVAKVPHGAEGFVVETPPAVLKDLGTEFGVSVRGPDSVDVAVFDGLVDVQERSTGKIRRIKEGNTARVVAKRLTVIPSAGEIPPPGDATTQAAVDTSRRNVQITNVTGRGKDAFVLSSDPRALPGQLQVKNVDKASSAYHRKSYIAFDLAPVAGETIVSARVEFTLVPPAGIPPRFPDATFAVYGLNDGPTDEWGEKTIDWDNAPANGPGGAGIDPRKAVLLGRFVVKQGVLNGTFGVEGPELKRFLDADRNGLATMIIVRETAHAGETSMIHAFAGWSHPSATPPTLKLTTSRGNVEISNATGRGKDAFIVSYGTTPPASAAPGVLNVKNAGKINSPYHRKAYVAFDLASIAGETVLGARVEFTLLPTPFSSRFPDATFAVYGVTEDALDEWDEKDIKWCNAPARRDGGDDVMPTLTVLLGRFTVEQGVQQGTFGVEGDALVELLKKDRNGLLTLILVRETAGEDEKSVIHSFAGRHHPWATPPTLKLSLRASSGDRRQPRPAGSSSLSASSSSARTPDATALSKATH